MVRESHHATGNRCSSYLRGRLFSGDHTKISRMPTVRRSPQPKMVKVRGTRAPEGFGLDEEEIKRLESQTHTAHPPEQELAARVKSNKAGPDKI